MIAAGEFAPDFSLPSAPGRTLALSALRGRVAVLVFYPQDGSPTCTAEVTGFSARARAFARAGSRVLGINPDSVASHERFSRKHGLGFPLLADADAEVCRLYGTWGEKTTFGRTYMGVIRTTVLIDGDGLVRQVWSPVRLAGHVEAVLAAVKALPPAPSA